jgi:hypothetical protein
MHVSPAEVQQSTFNIKISEGSQQHHFNLQLDQQLKEVFFYGFYDPVADYFEYMSSINVKTFLSDEDCFCHQPYFCMLHSLLFLGSKSRTRSVNQFLTWLHWKHDFTW